METQVMETAARLLAHLKQGMLAVAVVLLRKTRAVAALSATTVQEVLPTCVLQGNGPM